MSGKHKVTLVSTSPNTARLSIDGMDISRNVTGLSLDVLRATDGYRMTLDVIPVPMEIDLEGVRVDINEEMHDLLVWLGWTPPPEEEDTADALD